ncbi:MAG: DUF4350 domain-containing protein [Oscillochloridaceae bacterium]|nr:DUF4350 domain-containing protein [Chloroflexaceae bacterium]MDW8391402.1 DUF4350 domain-containing protein [Oscillochloridaceae bacterium]
MRRDVIILAGLFAVLALFIALGPGRAASVPGTGASSHASGPQGALALYRWIDALGYDVRRLQYRERFAPDPAAAVLIVLGPGERYTLDEATAVAEWVEDGGILVLADNRPGQLAGAAALFRAFDLELFAPPQDQLPEPAPVLQPVFNDPPAQAVVAEATTALRTTRADAVPLVGAGAAPLVLGLPYGAGYVFASATLHPFTNRGLNEGDNAAMVLNMLRRAPPGGRVVFDEYHHGFISQPSLRSLLLGTPWGWAILYIALMLAAYLALTGRRFGRPAPLREETARRSSAEYLESMAGLLRRAGRRDALQAHYRATFKRRLARASGLNPHLDDAAFLAALAAIAPERAERAGALLAAMAAPVASDAVLLRLVAEADQMVDVKAGIAE